MTDSPYAAQAPLIAAARRAPDLWRLAVGLVLVAAAVVVLNTGLQSALIRLTPRLWLTHFVEPGYQGATPFSMLVTLYSFGFVIVGVGLTLRLLHHRDLASLMGPGNVLMYQFMRVIAAMVAVGAVLMVLPPYNMGMEVRQNLPFSSWLVLLPLSLIGVVIQSASEEVLFRGYIQQQLAARFSSPLVWMALPSALFALGHYLPVQAGDNALLIALWAGMFGLMMADLTARAGSLGPAIAVHVANNVSALIFVSLPDSLNGLALYVVPVSMADTIALRAWLPVDFATALVCWLAARLAIRR